MKKIVFIALFHFLFANGQSYTITPKSTNSNGTTYEVKQNGTGAYQNPQSSTPSTTSAQHYQNLQNNISNNVNQVSNSLSSSMTRQMEQAGIVYLGNGVFKITEVGSSGFVGTKKLVERANNSIEKYSSGLNKKFSINSTETYKQSFGVLPKAIIVFTLLEEDGTPSLTVKERVKMNEELKDNYKKITKDILINNNSKYKSICINNIEGWKPEENKKTIVEILESGKKLKLYSDLSLTPDSIKHSKETLFINIKREAIGNYSRLTNLTVRNSDNDIVFLAEFKNIKWEEILLPFTENDYKYSKEMAINKIKEYKQLLELGVISKDEYEMKINELKPILLGE
jgi:hypothetical protein